MTGIVRDQGGSVVTCASDEGVEDLSPNLDGAFFREL